MLAVFFCNAAAALVFEYRGAFGDKASSLALRCDDVQQVCLRRMPTAIERVGCLRGYLVEPQVGSSDVRGYALECLRR